MVKILCIGNSFSQDASRYVWGISRADGQEIKIVNLYIGGCDLAKHYRNMMGEKRAYSFEINGMTNTGVSVSVKDALLMDNWDYVTLQQQSLQAADFETFQPYLSALADYVRTMCPKAKLMMFQTWGYEDGSKKLAGTPYETHEEMFLCIRNSYAKAKDAIEAKGIIPGGEAVCMAVKQNAFDVYRDGFHMSYGFGRYLLGLLFYGSMIGENIKDNTFCDFDEPISEEGIALAKDVAIKALFGDAK
jgi:hypothetical protein